MGKKRRKKKSTSMIRGSAVKVDPLGCILGRLICFPWPGCGTCRAFDSSLRPWPRRDSMPSRGRRPSRSCGRCAWRCCRGRWRRRGSWIRPSTCSWPILFTKGSCTPDSSKRFSFRGDIYDIADAAPTRTGRHIIHFTLPNHDGGIPAVQVESRGKAHVLRKFGQIADV